MSNQVKVPFLVILKSYYDEYNASVIRFHCSTNHNQNINHMLAASWTSLRVKIHMGDPSLISFSKSLASIKFKPCFFTFKSLDPLLLSLGGVKLMTSFFPRWVKAQELDRLYKVASWSYNHGLSKMMLLTGADTRGTRIRQRLLNPL